MIKNEMNMTEDEAIEILKDYSPVTNSFYRRNSVEIAIAISKIVFEYNKRKENETFTQQLNLLS